MNALVTRARLLRVAQSASCFSSWCARRCPIGAFILVIAVHLFSAGWWKVVCNTLIAIAVMLIFCAFGFSGVMDSLTVYRPKKWYEYLGKVLGAGIGVVLMFVGVLGGWTFFKVAVLGLLPHE